MNPRYIVFDEATGSAIRWGDCPAADLERQAFHPGEVVRRIDGDIDPLNIPTLSDVDASP
ncbi:MAG: hypothetical protein ACK4TR_08865 [Phenylobacterium sp.]|uniref:hypothetical protein n=1 Tax=Phenylobacterium sp. TaxID=1871053 RepID=UPI00391A792D